MSINVQRYAVKCPGCGVVLYYVPHKIKASFCPFCRHFFISSKYESGTQIEAKDVPTCLACSSRKKKNVLLEILDSESYKCPNCQLKYRCVKHESLVSPLPDVIYPYRVSRKLAAKLMATWLMQQEDVPEDVLNDFLPEYIDAVYIPVFLFEGEYKFRWEVETEKNGKKFRKRGVVDEKFRIPLQACEYTPETLNHLFVNSLEEEVSGVEPIKDLDEFAMVPILSFKGNVDEIYESEILPSLKENFKRQAKIKAKAVSDEEAIVNIDSRIKKGKFKTYYLPFWIVTYRYQGTLYKCGVDAIKGIYCGGDIPKKKQIEDEESKVRKNFFIGGGVLLLAIILFLVNTFMQTGKLDAVVFSYYIWGILALSVFCVLVMVRFFPHFWVIYDSKRRKQLALSEFLAFHKLERVAELDVEPFKL